MTTMNDPQRLIGRTAVDASGDKIGKINQVYVDDDSGRPTWVTVHTGMFGSKESFAPLAGATEQGDDLALAVEKSVVKDAPQVDDDGHISEQEQQALFEYYSGYLGGEASRGAGYEGGRERTTGMVDTRREPDTTVSTGNVGNAGVVEDAGTTGRVEPRGHDTSGPTTDDAMTRSEERLHVGKEQVETGRARLRKYVVTENVTKTVPVQREEVRVEREPITEGNRDRATDGPAISEEEHEVTLHEERPVVEKEAVPVERVRLGTEQVTEEQQVNEEVRKEQIDTDGIEGRGTTRG